MTTTHFSTMVAHRISRGLLLSASLLLGVAAACQLPSSNADDDGAPQASDGGGAPPSADAGPALEEAGPDGGGDPADPVDPRSNICNAPPAGPTCGDGCAFADGNSACPRPEADSQERCDDGNTNDGDGCSSQCLVEPGFSCTIAGIPGVCWREPTYADLRPTSDPIVEDRPGMRAASYHNVHLVVAEPLRITLAVDSVQLGDCPTDVRDDLPGEAFAELIRIGTTSNTYVPLDATGSANIPAGEYRLVIRSGPTRLGRYELRATFGPS